MLRLVDSRLVEARLEDAINLTNSRSLKTKIAQNIIYKKVFIIFAKCIIMPLRLFV